MSTRPGQWGDRREAGPQAGPAVVRHRECGQPAERSAGLRKLFRLVQLNHVAERIVQEGLVPGAGDERERRQMR